MNDKKCPGQSRSQLFMIVSHDAKLSGCQIYMSVASIRHRGKLTCEAKGNTDLIVATIS